MNDEQSEAMFTSSSSLQLILKNKVHNFLLLFYIYVSILVAAVAHS